MHHRKLCKQSRFHPGPVKGNCENCQCAQQVEVVLSEASGTVVVDTQVFKDGLWFCCHKQPVKLSDDTVLLVTQQKEKICLKNLGVGYKVISFFPTSLAVP